VVEHLLAKEDVASSSLVTRSSLRLKAQRQAKAGASAVVLAKADLIQKATAGKPASEILLRNASTWIKLAFAVMHYVYLLRSESYPNQQYIGSTQNLRQRFLEHNSGRSPHTAKFCPWLLVAYFAFARKHVASAFEKYLKSGSGRGFAKRHF
jgi:putative endonuclease